MKLCDLHCDTALWLYLRDASLADNPFHISEKLFCGYEKYIQLAAVFTSPRLSNDEGYSQFWKVRERLIRECEMLDIPLVGSSSELKAAIRDRGRAFILTVEDVRIIDGDVSRIRELYDAGVRVITPLWGGETVIGGSHDTSVGLSDFGVYAVEEMTKLGIIPDISHASDRACDEIMDVCEAARVSPIATHMNSRAVCDHTRNLTDVRFERLCSLGGICGISLCPEHLTEREECTSGDAVRHIMHYSEIARDRVAFGCDFDGVGKLPMGLENISRLPTLVPMLKSEGFTESDVSALFYENAEKFLINNLPER